MPTRWVHVRVDEKLHEKMRAAALADRRSLSNWVALTVERALAPVHVKDESDGAPA